MDHESISRCTELLREANLHPASWCIIIKHSLLVARVRYLTGLVSHYSGEADYKDDTQYIPDYRSCCRTTRHVVDLIEVITFDRLHWILSRDQSYSQVKSHVLSLIDMDLCHQINQIVKDYNITVPPISEEVIMNNMHNPFIRQYHELYGSLISRPLDLCKRKLTESQSHEHSPNPKKRYLEPGAWSLEPGMLSNF